MKPRILSTARLSYSFAAAIVALFATSAHGQALYWDGNTSTANADGGNGTWDNLTTSNWDNRPFGGADTQWDNSLNSAFFGGVPGSGNAGTVSLAAGGITTGGITFNITGYTIQNNTLTFGGTNNTVTLNNSVTAATISSSIGTSAANMTFTAQNPLTNHTLTFGGAGNWTGTTTINAGLTLQLNSTSTALLNTSGITLNGGSIIQNYVAAVDRISSAAITSYGGTIATNTPNTALVIAETIGAVTLERGLTTFIHNASNTNLTSQNIILSGLTRNGTSAVSFASSGGVNATKNLITVTGATATTAGQIIGSWATTGNTASQSDYAVYNGSAQVVPAGIAASLQSSWTTAANAYTANATASTGLAGSFTLSGGTKNITALKSLSSSTATTADFSTDVITQASHVFADGDAVVFNTATTLPTGLALNTPYFVRDVSGSTYKLAATQGGLAIDFTVSNGSGITATGAILVSTGNNLGTTGILNASANTMYIAATGTGVVTLPTTTADNLHVNAGSAPIIISAPITDNTGALSLVKNGANALTLTGTNTFKGGIVVNSGSVVVTPTAANGFVTGAAGGDTINGGNLTYSSANAWGVTGRNVTFNGTGSLTSSVAYTGGTLTVNSGANAQLANTGNLVYATTTGTGAIIHTPGSASSLLNLGNASGFTGNLQNRGASGATNTGIQFSSLGDGGAIQFAGGNSDSGQAATFTYNGTGTLTFDTRQVQILDRLSGANWEFRDNTLANNSANGGNNWIINTDLLVTGGRWITAFGGSAEAGRLLILSGTNTADNAFNGIISNGTNPNGIGLSKTGVGKWILGGAGTNTYSGTTTISGGTLNIQNANALGSTGNGTLVASGATLQLQGALSYAAEALTLTNNTTSTPILQNVSGNNTWNGTITTTGVTASSNVRIQADADTLTLAGNIDSATLSNGSVVLQGASAINVTGQITGAGGLISGSVNAGSSSIRTLSNTSNNYTGATSITGGTLVGIGANAFGSTTGISVGNTTSAILSLRGDTSTNFVKASDSTPYAVTTTTATGVTVDVDRATIAGTSAKTMTIGTLLLNTAVTNSTTFTGANNTSLSIGAVTTGNSASGTETLTNNISGGGSLTLASIAVARTGTPTLAFAGTGNTTVTGNITQAATTALTKSGGGVLTLGGNSNYTGTTTVSAGKLFINGNQTSATGAVTVSALATLGGTGIIGGNTTIADTGKLEFDISTIPGSHDKLDLATGKTLSFGANCTLTINSISGATTGDYTLLTAPGGIGTLPTFTLSLPLGWTANVTRENSNTDLVLHLTSLGGPGPVDHFDISAIGSPQTVGTPITPSITLTAKDSSGATATGFTGTVTFGGTGGFSGTSTSFTLGQLTGVSVTPTNAGSGLTFTVNDGSGHTGLATISTIQTQYDAWSGGAAFDVDSNGDGVKNGLAWLLGAPNKDANANSFLPTVSQNSGDLTLTFDCLSGANRGNATLNMQYSKDLGISDLWTSHTAAVPGTQPVTTTVNGVNYVTTPNGALIHVVATVPATAAAPGTTLFGRLNAVTTP